METCPDCGKPGIKHLTMHTRYCPGKKGRKANATAAAKKAEKAAAAAKKYVPATPKQPANIAAEASEGLRFAAMCRKKAAEHRAKAGQLDDMAKASETLL